MNRLIYLLQIQMPRSIHPRHIPIVDLYVSYVVNVTELYDRVHPRNYHRVVQYRIISPWKKKKKNWWPFWNDGHFSFDDVSPWRGVRLTRIILIDYRHHAWKRVDLLRMSILRLMRP